MLTEVTHSHLAFVRHRDHELITSGYGAVPSPGTVISISDMETDERRPWLVHALEQGRATVVVRLTPVAGPPIVSPHRHGDYTLHRLTHRRQAPDLPIDIWALYRKGDRPSSIWSTRLGELWPSDDGTCWLFAPSRWKHATSRPDFRSALDALIVEIKR